MFPTFRGTIETDRQLSLANLMEPKFNRAAARLGQLKKGERDPHTPPFPSEEVREKEKTGAEVRWGVVQCPPTHPLTLREFNLFVASM